jgi:hypothetical protein
MEKDLANMQLKQYECNKNTLYEKLHIPVLDSKEKLEISYVITYSSNGKILHYPAKDK